MSMILKTFLINIFRKYLKVKTKSILNRLVSVNRQLFKLITIICVNNIEHFTDLY